MDAFGLQNSGSIKRTQREFFIDNLLVRVNFIIVMIRWTGLAPREFESSFPGSLTSTFLFKAYTRMQVADAFCRDGPHSIGIRSHEPYSFVQFHFFECSGSAFAQSLYRLLGGFSRAGGVLELEAAVE